MSSLSSLLPLLATSAVMPTVAASQSYDADAISQNFTLMDTPRWDNIDKICGAWNVPSEWTPDWRESYDYNWWPEKHPEFHRDQHYWVNQVTGHVRNFPCGEPMDLMRNNKTGRVYWQSNKNESTRWTDPLIPHRWWSTWIGEDGKPYWMDDFTHQTSTEEPLNANWSITLRNSHDCNDEKSIIGQIRHPIANGCYPLDAHGQFDLGSGLDKNSFRYKGSFTIYPGPCKIRIFKAAGCPSDDIPWLTHDPAIRWEEAGRLAAVNPEQGPTCLKVNEGEYAYNNMTQSMTVLETDKARFCTDVAEQDNPGLTQGSGWPENLTDVLTREMHGKWYDWWKARYDDSRKVKDIHFGQYITKLVKCRKNVEWGYIQKGLQKEFAPSVQVSCPAEEISHWWTSDQEP
ncbi:hypothetical protein VP1G_09987 [Cytospora mali]|uniref:PI-PLC Y-box domain-containing protein n=1 Tax=Cytospora mali TaxID=578113 RepID=A0A194VFR8_CYTMA|nr:hypothetical protein VP1G_09987 [Valsa mali var. pyri (nom. inval.)]